MFKVVVVVTDSSSSDNVTASSKIFRSYGIPVFAVGFRVADLDGLSAIATERKNVLMSPEGAVHSLPKLTPNLVSLISESTKEGECLFFCC